MRALTARQKAEICELCEAPFHGFGGIQTTHGYICYECVRWVHAVADQTAALRDSPARELLLEIDAAP